MILVAKGVCIIHRHKLASQNRDKFFCGQCVSPLVCQENSMGLLGVGSSNFMAFKKNKCLSTYESQKVHQYHTCPCATKQISLVKLQFQGDFYCLLLIALGMKSYQFPSPNPNKISFPYSEIMVFRSHRISQMMAAASELTTPTGTNK